MFWNVWIIGLLLGELAIFIIFTIAIINSIKILKYWDPDSYSSLQLQLEHRSELISTVIFWTLTFQIASLFVIVFASDSLSSSIPGAMCAVGVFQNSKIGWYAIGIKILGLFLYGWWLLIQKWDENLEGYPLIIIKNKYLIFTYIFFIIDLILEFLFFFNLNPQVVTSCCGVIFGAGTQSASSFLITIPPHLMEIVTFSFFIFMIFIGFKISDKKFYFLYGILSLIALVIGVMGIISFVAPYVYVEPTVHCPFCLIKPENYYFGYLIFITLFIGCFFGSSSLPFSLLLKKNKMLQKLNANIRKLIRYSSFFYMIFLLLTILPIIKFFIDMKGFVDLFKGVY